MSMPSHVRPRRLTMIAMRKAVLIPIMLLGVLVVGAGIGVAAYDHARRELIAPGVRIGGVAVGGLRAGQARARLQRVLGPALAEPVVVRAGTRRFTLPAARIDARVDVAGLVDRAVAVSRRGSILTRTIHGLRGTAVHTNLPVEVSYAHGAVDGLARRVVAALDRPARNAAAHPHASGLKLVTSRNGVRVDRQALRAALAAALARADRPRTVDAKLVAVRPKVSTARLRAKYASYIVIDRDAFTLRFYRHLKLSRSYPIAVGMQGLETPAGLYDIQWKQTNPSWYVPNSPWAGALAGKVIPPGPDDPLKARWMAFNGGAGIHGIDPSEYGTIGHNASHGCVRMRIPDVIELYAKTPVGTPVYIA
jgi:lipoprotein-anchoring transpeptidase ErfK/SrfK